MQTAIDSSSSPQYNIMLSLGGTMIEPQHLFAFARYGIESYWGTPEIEKPPISFELNNDGASFVTLTIDGNLRGCVGTLMARRPLWYDIQENGYHAAFKDFRFSPLTEEEYKEVAVEVSILTPTERIDFDSVDTLRSIIRPGIDGILYECRGHRATFLPQVWEKLPDFDSFFSHLAMKAGIGPDPMLLYASIERYQVEKYHE